MAKNARAIGGGDDWNIQLYSDNDILTMIQTQAVPITSGYFIDEAKAAGLMFEIRDQYEERCRDMLTHIGLLEGTLAVKIAFEQDS